MLKHKIYKDYHQFIHNMKLTNTKHYNYLQDSLQGLFIVNIPIKTISGTILAVLCYVTGADAKVLEIIGMLLLADFFMGILVAIKHRTLSSDYIISVLYKAAMYFVLLMGANWFMQICPWFKIIAGNAEISIRTAMHFLIASAELISILENAGLLGFKNAKKIINMINKNVEEKLNKQ